jgi:hypothetical protein
MFPRLTRLIGQRPIALNAPERYQLDGEEVVTVTAIDANHCPGSVMYASSCDADDSS